MKRITRLLCLCVGVNSVAYTHETSTHERIGDAAVVYLQTNFPNRPFLGGSAQQLQTLLHVGAVHEDDVFLPTGIPIVDNHDPYGRFIFHFTPALQFNLTISNQLYPGIVSANGCASINWAQNNEAVGAPNGEFGCIASCSIPTAPSVLAVLLLLGWLTDFNVLAAADLTCTTVSATPQTNVFRWDQDLTTDNTGAPTQAAVQNFGYVVHLLEDLGSPPHTRNDLHACPLGLIYCDEFEKYNDFAEYGAKGAGDPTAQTGWSAFLVGPPAIPTATLTTPTAFFNALQEYTSTYYYSNRTVFQQGMPGPQMTFSDANYFYGACLVSDSGVAVSQIAGTCQQVTNPTTGQAFPVRKIAHKGAMYWHSCATPLINSAGALNEAGCDVTKADIDETIGREQFAELGPVIAQHVAAFIMFYAPALTVTIQGTGTVTSSPGAGVNCSSGTCSALFVQDATVKLTANPPGSSVTWSGGGNCSGTATSVTIQLTIDMTCTATFNPEFTLTVQVQGSGNVTSNVGNLNCGMPGTACSALIASGTVVTLTASGGTFFGWSGACSGTATSSTVTVTGNETCTATFLTCLNFSGVVNQIDLGGPSLPPGFGYGATYSFTAMYNSSTPPTGAVSDYLQWDQVFSFQVTVAGQTGSAALTINALNGPQTISEYSFSTDGYVAAVLSSGIGVGFAMDLQGPTFGLSGTSLLAFTPTQLSMLAPRTTFYADTFVVQLELNGVFNASSLYLGVQSISLGCIQQ